MNAYRLDDLGWQQFESLCQTLLKARLSLAVEAWGGHSDLGRDAYWQAQESHPLLSPGRGPVIFQCKFIQNAHAAGARPGPALEYAVAAECNRIVERRRKGALGDVGTYVLITNAPLFPRERERLTRKLQGVLQGCTLHMWGYSDLCAILADQPDIRAAFPQLLGLGDLQTLIADAVGKARIQRSHAYLELALEQARTFVPTRAYYEALELLEQHSFVMLAGPPEAGKTTIARIIGLLKFQEGWQYHECRQPEDFFQFRQHGQRQIFIVDDVFGATEYRPDSANTWGADLDAVLKSLNPACWLIWTSRSAPLAVALKRMNLQGSAEHFPSPADITVDAHALSSQERAQILYRHVKRVTLPEHLKEPFKGLALDAIADQHFTPLRARKWIERIGKHPWGSGFEDDRQALISAFHDEIQNPTEMMRKSFRALSAEHQQVLISLLDTDAHHILSKECVEEAAHQLFPETVGKVGQLLADLEDHFLRGYLGYAMTEDGCSNQNGYGWTHPSWRDLVIEHLSENTPLRRQFLSRCGIAGATLALSIAGGVGGERQRPFLHEPADWDALSESCARAVQLLGSRGTEYLLESIYQVLPQEAPLSVRDPAHGKLLDLTRSTLTACRRAWDGHPELPTVGLLALYYRLSELLSPLPESPSLHACWERSTSALVQSLEGKDARIIIGNLTEWCNLAELLRENEPRFLRQVNFPGNNQKELRLFFDWMRGAMSTWDDEHDYWRLHSHVHDTQTVRRHIQELIDIAPELTEELDSFDTQLRSKLRTLRRRMQAVSRPVPEPYSWADGEDSGNEQAGTARSRNPESFDIRELFADL